MKNKLKKFIYNLIKDTYPDISEFVTKTELQYTFEKMENYLSMYSQGECIACDKVIATHYGGFYRNSKGQVFCSHGCIDSFKLINLEK